MHCHRNIAFGTDAYAFNVAGHALAGGVSAAGAPLTSGMNGVQGLVASSVLGGIGSVAGGGKFANGAITGAFGYLFNSQFKSRTAIPFLDVQGHPVLDWLGQPMMRPSDVDPQFFIDEGKASGLSGLSNFGQGGSWDVQRVGSDQRPTQAFIDYATVGIGLYGAAAGISESTILGVEDSYAKYFSNFGKVLMDTTYTNLPARNVYNTHLGYQLYQSGRIGGTP